MDVINNMDLHNLKPYIDGSYISRFKSECPIKFPKCIIDKIIYNKESNSVCYLLFKDDYIKEWYNNLEKKCLEYIFKRHDEWFDNELTYVDLENMMENNLTNNVDGSILKCYLNYDINKVDNCLIYDKNYECVGIEYLEKKEIIPRAYIYGIRFTRSKIEIYIKLKKILIVPNDNNKINLNEELYNSNEIGLNDLEEIGLNDLEEIEININNTERVNLNSRDNIYSKVYNKVRKKGNNIIINELNNYLKSKHINSSNIIEKIFYETDDIMKQMI